MKMYRSLLVWQLRRAAPLTIAALMIALGGLLFNRELFRTRDIPVTLFVLVHTYLLSTRLWRPLGGPAGFLYTRGCSRDQIWAHTQLATILAVAMVWLPSSLMIWLEIRSGFQDGVVRNPLFPLLASAEMMIPWVWLAMYAVAMPVFEYWRLRAAQNSRDRHAGLMIVIVFVVCFLMIIDIIHRHEWLRWSSAAGALTLVLAALWGGFYLHRRVEVRT